MPRPDSRATRASKRTIYYISCPATRRAFVSAARELALDPAFGPDGLWTRVEQLQVPAAFVWGDKDRIIGTSHSRYVQDAVPQALQVHVPCAGHFDNGPHFLCMEDGAIEAVRHDRGAGTRPSARHRLSRRAATGPVYGAQQAAVSVVGVLVI